jgi:uncharacterized protein YdeI (BOF family)
MKKLFFILLCGLMIAACNNDPRLKMPQTGTFGTAFTPGQTVSVQDVSTALDTANNIPVQVSGTVTQYCKGEGCWLTLKNDNGEDLFVEVKDKAFVLPHNLENKTAIANGVARKDTVEGKLQLSVEATGIVIQ